MVRPLVDVLAEHVADKYPGVISGLSRIGAHPHVGIVDQSRLDVLESAKGEEVVPVMPAVPDPAR
jgi:hypothetical protein